MESGDMEQSETSGGVMGPGSACAAATSHPATAPQSQEARQARKARRGAGGPAVHFHCRHGRGFASAGLTVDWPAVRLCWKSPRLVRPNPDKPRAATSSTSLSTPSTHADTLIPICIQCDSACDDATVLPTASFTSHPSATAHRSGIRPMELWRGRRVVRCYSIGERRPWTR